MNQARFEQLFDRTIDEIRHLLIVKGGEYAGSEDRLANFKRGAQLTGVTPMQCLLVYMSKHYDAVSTYIRDEAAGKTRPRSEPIEGRIDDLINYCILLKALVEEERHAPKREPDPLDPDDLGEFISQQSARFQRRPL